MDAERCHQILEESRRLLADRFEPREPPLPRASEAFDAAEFQERVKREKQQRRRLEDEQRQAAVAPAIDWHPAIAEAIAAEREFIMETVGQALGGLLDRERAEISREIASKISTHEVAVAKLEATVARLRAEIAELHVAIHNKGAVIDLPKWPSEVKH